MDFVAAFFPYDLSVAIFGLATLLGSFILIAVLELLRPARRGLTGREGRMTVNFGLGLLNMALSAALPISSLAMATLAQAQGWGLFHYWDAPWVLAVPALLLVKSLMGYGIHWSFHNIAWLWPLHAVHHRDDAVDLSTSFRSHPLNHLIVLMPNALLMLALGPDVWVVLVTEAILMFAVLFQHANFHIPDRLSDQLERWLVTPRMHLVHHARERHLHDSNYGETFAIWDRLFGTYRVPPQEDMQIGVEIPAKPFWQLR